MKGERLRREDAEREWDVEGGESALPLLSLRSAAAGSTGRRWWGRTVLWAVFAIVLIECAFIVRLDILNSPATSSSHTSESASRFPGHDGVLRTNTTRPSSGVCSKEWLEKADRVHYSRDFKTDPVVVEAGGEQQVLLCPSILSFVTRMFSALFYGYRMCLLVTL